MISTTSRFGDAELPGYLVADSQLLLGFIIAYQFPLSIPFENEVFDHGEGLYRIGRILVVRSGL